VMNEIDQKHYLSPLHIDTGFRVALFASYSKHMGIGHPHPDPRCKRPCLVAFDLAGTNAGQVKYRVPTIRSYSRSVVVTRSKPGAIVRF
jgi:hypothetical protein